MKLHTNMWLTMRESKWEEFFYNVQGDNQKEQSKQAFIWGIKIRNKPVIKKMGTVYFKLADSIHYIIFPSCYDGAIRILVWYFAQGIL